MFVALKARGASMENFLSLFSSKDFVSNDRTVGHWLRHRIVDQIVWNNLKKTRSDDHKVRSIRFIRVKLK